LIGDVNLDISQIITYITANIDKIIPLIIIGVFIVILFKVVNKIVKILSSIVFILYMLIQLFGRGWIQTLISWYIAN